jgi:hypothetical protein
MMLYLPHVLCRCKLGNEFHPEFHDPGHDARDPGMSDAVAAAWTCLTHVLPTVTSRRKPLSYTRRTITQTDVAVARARVAELFEAAYLIRSVRIGYCESNTPLMAAGIRRSGSAHLHLDVNNNYFVYRGWPHYRLDDRSNSSL